MSTLLLLGSRRCDATCYTAHEDECSCVCRGRNHGLGFDLAAERCKTMRGRRGLRILRHPTQLFLLEGLGPIIPTKPRRGAEKESDDMSDDDETQDLFTPPAKTGEQEKAEGIASVTEHQKDEAPDFFEEMLLSVDLMGARTFTSEDLVALCDTKPVHPNATGAAMRKLALAGVIEKTGMFEKCTRPSAHARVTFTWRRTGR